MNFHTSSEGRLTSKRPLRPAVCFDGSPIASQTEPFCSLQSVTIATRGVVPHPQPCARMRVPCMGHGRPLNLELSILRNLFRVRVLLFRLLSAAHPWLRVCDRLVRSFQQCMMLLISFDWSRNYHSRSVLSRRGVSCDGVKFSHMRPLVGIN